MTHFPIKGSVKNYFVNIEVSMFLFMPMGKYICFSTILIAFQRRSTRSVRRYDFVSFLLALSFSGKGKLGTLNVFFEYTLNFECVRVRVI